MGLDDAGRDHGADEVALAGWAGGEQACEAELAEGGQHGLDGAVGPRAENLEGCGGIDEGAPGELRLEQVDGLVGEVREVGEGLFLDSALGIALGAAQELGAVELAVLDRLDDGDVHGGNN